MRRDSDRESRTRAGFAFDSHIAAEQRRQLPAERQPQTGPLRLALQRIFELCELLEDARMVCGGDPYPCVGHIKCYTVASGRERGADAHFAALGEFQSVRDEVA